MKTAFIYALLALVAMSANIAVQDVLVRIYAGYLPIPLAEALGTVVGLMVKYGLDKRYIFAFVARDARHDTRTFLLYALMGVATTFIFWGFEFGFHHLFQSKEMRYFGAVLGLTIGYVSKYYLDKKYVFQKHPA